MTARGTFFGTGSPDNVVEGALGDFYTDASTGIVYAKSSNGGKLCWMPITDIGRLGSGYFRFNANPVAGASITIEGTETWTCVAGAPAARQFQRGGTVFETLVNLMIAMGTDPTSMVYVDRGITNTLWVATKGFADVALACNVGGGGPTDIVPSGPAWAKRTFGAREPGRMYQRAEEYVITDDDVLVLAPGASADYIPIGAFIIKLADSIGNYWLNCPGFYDGTKPLSFLANYPDISIAPSVFEDTVFWVEVYEAGVAGSLSSGNTINYIPNWSVS